LLVGTNPRFEAPLLNSRIRKGFLHHELEIGVIGPKVELNYEYEVSYKHPLCQLKSNSLFLQHLGNATDVLKQLASGQHAFSKKLAAAKKPMLILGSEQLKREDGAAILSLAQQIAHAASSGVINCMHTYASY